MTTAILVRWSAIPIIASVVAMGCTVSETWNPVTGGGTSSATGAGGASSTTTSSSGGGDRTATSSSSTTTSSSGGAGGSTATSSSTTTSGSGGAGSTTTSGTGGGNGCAAATDCPGVDTTCATRTCIAGTCGIAFAAQGFLAGMQTSGDCLQVVCDGNGGMVTAPDDTDVPNDGDPCTQDVCSSGEPSHLPAPAGTACGPGGQLACDDAGKCVGCAADADCGVSTACVAYTCDTVSGLCSVIYAPSGQGDPGGQTAGDCQKVVCNGNGGTLSIADDTDVPDDGNPCTDGGCSLGQPTHTPKGTGAPCGNGFECDGDGACLACLADSDCGAPTACATPACVSGACVTGYVPSGQGDPGGQTAGDCQKVVCNGSGGTLSIADDTDVPDDGNPCTVDACSSGVASHTLLPPGASCGVDLVCDGEGSCVGCLTDADCGTSTVCATRHCQMGACVAENTPAGTGDPGGQVAGGCQKIVCDGSGGTTTVPDDTDVPDDGNPCTIDTCVGGAVQHLPGGCGAGLVCAGATCVPGCVIGGAYYAADVVNPSNPCQVCNPGVSTSAWSNRADATPCDDGDACTTGDHCQSGVCVGTAHPCTPGFCEASATCDGKGGCIHTAKPNGTFCDTPGLFTTPGVCYSGVCYPGCWINGGYYEPNGSVYGAAICRVCDPSRSRTSFAYEGYGCHDGLPITAQGTCSGGICYMYTHDASCADQTVKPCSGGLCYGWRSDPGAYIPWNPWVFRLLMAA